MNIFNNNNNNNSDEIIHSGYLTKQGGTVQNWKIRWFVLKKGTLSYYSTNVNWETQKPRGVIYLNLKTEVKEANYKNRRYCFTVKPNYNNLTASSDALLLNSNNISPNNSSDKPNHQLYNRVYLISAQTVFDQRKWIDMIKIAQNDDRKYSSPPVMIKKPIGETLLQAWRRKDSLPSSPSLLNRTIAPEQLNDSIRVQLSKRKFYFYHDNLTIPSLSYVDSDGQQPSSYSSSPLILNGTHRSTSPQSSYGTGNNTSNSTPSSGTTRSISPPSSSTSPDQQQPQRSMSPQRTMTFVIGGTASSPFYTPITQLPIPVNNNNNNNTGGVGGSGGTTNSHSSGSGGTSTHSSVHSGASSTTPISISPSSSPPSSPRFNNGVPRPQSPSVHRHQPKIIVHHLVRDYFQISNIGSCSFSYEILSPFDPNYNLTFSPSSGTVQKGEQLTISVELIAYNHVEIDIYSTLHIKGGMEFTLYCRVETDPYLPLFLQACSGVELNSENKQKMITFIKSNPSIIKSLQELAHTMISEGRYIDPKSQHSPNSIPKSLGYSIVRLSKYTLNFRGGKKNSGPAKIYQRITDKFLISNSGQTEANFQFYQPDPNKKLFSLSLVPTNGIITKGEWFYIKASLTVFEQTELSEVIQLVINQREIHYILITVKCENIHSGNKEIDVDKELKILEKLGSGATGDIYKATMSLGDIKKHLSQLGGFEHSNGGSGVSQKDNSNNSGNWVSAKAPGAIPDEDNHIVVAVKKLHQFDDPTPEMMQEFFAEVRVLSMLSHPNIVKYVGGSTKIRNWSIVMEYIPGGNLMDCLADHSLVIPYKLVLKMAIDIAKGIHYLHSLGILHLDLKSPNLLVLSLSLNSKVNIKVADFNTCINRSRITGIFVPSVLQQSNSVENFKDKNPNLYHQMRKGTTLWMAPEVIKGTVYSEKCDTYSFGIIMWEMITRTLPYSDIAFNSEIENRVLEGYRPPIPLNCDPNYAEIMQECWHQDPDKRPAFDTIVHRLTKLLSNYEIEEQKMKSTINGLRRTHSGSSIMSFKIPNSPSPCQLKDNTLSFLDLSTKQPNSTTTDDKVTSNVNNNNHLQNISSKSKRDIHYKHKSNRYSADSDMLYPNSKQLMELSQLTILENQSTIQTASTITVGGNQDSNLPFRFSPPTTPKSSFLILKKFDNDYHHNHIMNHINNSYLKNNYNSTSSYIQPPQPTTLNSNSYILQSNQNKKYTERSFLQYKPNFPRINIYNTSAYNQNNNQNSSNNDNR
ncbi:pleckstrin (PH) domain-containing protein [Tieghemostelium lacteum]|uniref:Pleckstrin (PH) domain-containing protein n=1 Tax=Tieghemostelium lacteum TaxID=361077 RepID=A0A151Z6A3_TIELA|nr:pleckstrin (PH) domain-containing protein [Tieghemostelium lacteum]|eukprot:KYQ89482.1 pleckstrin (PH) domain-containing protein [Tieghemostelium lacteum]